MEYYGNLLVQGALSSPNFTVGYTQQISGSGQVPIISGGSYVLPYPIGPLGTGPVVVQVNGQNVLGWGQTGIGSGYSGDSGFSGSSISISGSGYSGFSGYSGINGVSGISGYSGFSGISGFSGVVPAQQNTQIVYGTGAGVASSATFTWNNSGQVLNISGSNSAMPLCHLISANPISQATGGYTVGNIIEVYSSISPGYLQITGMSGDLVTSLAVISGGLFTQPLQTLFNNGSGLAFNVVYSSFTFTGSVIVGDNVNPNTNTAIGDGNIFTGGNTYTTGNINSGGNITTYGGNLFVTSSAGNSSSFNSTNGNTQITLQGGTNSVNGFIFTSGFVGDVGEFSGIMSLLSSPTKPFYIVDNQSSYTPIQYNAGSQNTGNVTFGNTTPSTNIGSGAVLISGGMAVAGASNIGAISTTFPGNVIAGVQSGTAAISGQVGEIAVTCVSVPQI